MARYRIAWLPGDGIGVDVMNATKIVLDALELDADYVPGDIGWEFWRTEGNALPDRTINVLQETDCALFGAITSKRRDAADEALQPELQGQGLAYSSPIVKLRQRFNLHTNLRPCRAYPGNPLNYREDIDILVFRENTEGMYAGVEFFPVPVSVAQALAVHPKMQPFLDRGLENVALSTRILTRQGCATICEDAFDWASKHGRERVTLAEKPNVLQATGTLMTETFRDVAGRYPTIAVDEANIDALAMWLVRKPETYDVIVAENLFGDILSDLCAGLVGGLGFTPSANFGDNYAVFEPTHGSAPKHAGLDKANPIAMILTAKLMLDWLGETELARRVDAAVAHVIRENVVRTYDVGGTSTTTEVAREIAKWVTAAA